MSERARLALAGMNEMTRNNALNRRMNAFNFASPGNLQNNAAMYGNMAQNALNERVDIGGAISGLITGMTPIQNQRRTLDPIAKATIQRVGNQLGSMRWR